MRKVIVMFIAALTSICTLKAQDMKELTTRQRSIATIASATAVGNLDALKNELAYALDAGMSINEINEVLIQMYAYCGFPRSLQGITLFMNLIDERQARGIDDLQGEEPAAVASEGKYLQGKETLERLTGIHETAPAGANAFAPGIDIFLKEHLFADIFGRGVLNYSDRELATVACLTSLGGVDPMLRSHFNMAMNTGLSSGQLRHAVEVVRELAGGRRADNALDILSQVASRRNN